MTLEEKMEFLENVLDLESGDFEPDTVLEDLEEWDSLSKLGLMGEVKTKLDRRLTVDEVKNFKTIQDIIDYLS